MSYSRETRVSIIFVAALCLAVLTLFLPASSSGANEEVEKEPPRDESIVGGKAVKDGQFKFVAALIDRSRSGSDYDRQFCAGTLIDANSVLTAAHCVDGRTPGSLEVIVGRTVLSSKQGVSRNVVNIKRHPKFRGSEIDSRFDVAVINLKSPVKGVAPIRISRPSNNDLERPGRTLSIAGWGSTARQQPGGSPSGFPDRMRQARVPVVSDSKMSSAYNRPNLPPQVRFYPTLMVGAGKTGKDSCQGDSGGPIFDKENGRVQVGITSYGLGCGAKGYPGVYTEINSPQIRAFIVRAS